MIDSKLSNEALPSSSPPAITSPAPAITSPSMDLDDEAAKKLLQEEEERRKLRRRRKGRIRELQEVCAYC
jgi:hypothetical protein